MKKELIIAIFISVLFTISFVIATHVITNVSSFNVNEDTNYTFNISVLNNDTTLTANITQVNISLPTGSGSSFIFNSNGTNGGTHTFSNTSAVLSWSNDGLVMNLTTKYFWFNASFANPGNYNITVKTSNSTYTTTTNLSLTVNDTTYPLVNVVFPVNGNNYSLSNLSFNLSLSDNVNISSCWFTLDSEVTNNTMTINSTLTGANYTRSGIAEGSHTAYFYCNDTSNLINGTTSSTFIFDTTKPLISFGSGMNASGNYVNRNWIYVNVTANDTYFKNVTFYLYNSSQVINQTNSSTATAYAINYTGLADGMYFFNATAYDYSGNLNSTETRNLTVDTTNPSLVINSPSGNYNTSSQILKLNITSSDSNFLSVNVSVYNSSAVLVGSNSSASALTGQNLTVNLSSYSDGTYTINVTAYDLAGRINTTSKTVIVDTTVPVISIYSPSNATSSNYANQSIFLAFLTYDLSIPNSAWINWNGTTNVTLTCLNCSSFWRYYYNSSLINYTSTGLKNITFYANDSLNNIATSTITINITSLNTTTTFVANDTTYNVNNSNITTVVVPYNSTLNNITLSNSLQTVSVDLGRLISPSGSGAATIGANNINLITLGSSNNYSAVLPAGANITGTSWDGKLNMPIVNTATFTQPPVSGYTTSAPSVVVDVGSSVELDLTSPAEVVLGGMAGKRAAWASSGSTTLTDISTPCTSVTDHSNINSVSPRECYVNDANGVDLDIWTYHFSSFAAYDATVVSSSSSPSSGGGGSYASTIGQWLVTYIVPSADFKQGFVKELAKNNRVKLSVNNVDKYIGLTTLTSNSAILDISNSSSLVVMNVLDQKKFDLNSDGYYDVSVKLESVSSNNAKLTMKSIYEKISPTVVQGNNSAAIATTDNSGSSSTTNQAGNTPQVNKSSILFKVVLGIIIVLIIIVIIAFFILRKNKKVNYRVRVR